MELQCPSCSSDEIEQRSRAGEAFAGFATGAAVGSVVPVIGTLVGGLIGTISGAALGSNNVKYKCLKCGVRFG
jgi:phage tail tape-measure protein